MIRVLTFALLLLAPARAAVAQPTGAALYEVVFTATWSAETHPVDFPANAHFSWLIGGTHDDQAVFWAVGDTASLGVETMAETGLVSPLDLEVLAAVDAGHAGEVIESDDYPFSPGSVATVFRATPAAPLVTLVSMVAPSPDWFVGVAGLDLRDGDAWAAVVTVPLYPYDAGTDSGPTFTSPDHDTVPPAPVAPIAGHPFTPGVPLGTFTFRLLGVSEVPPADAQPLALRAYPNPFNPRTVVALEAPRAGRARVAIHDARGRLVRVLADRPVAAGPLELAWDGRDRAGRPVAAGVYRVRASVGGAVARAGLVLVR